DQRKIYNRTKKTMATHLEKNDPFDDSIFQNHLPQYYRAILNDFRKVAKGYVNFNLLFFAIFAAEICLFFFFLPFWMGSPLFAIALGALFLTCFSYFVLLFYHQAKKPEQLIHLRDQFLESCRQTLSVPAGEAGHHLSIADALSKLAAYLQDFEATLYKGPKLFTRWTMRFSSYSYGEDVLKMKLLLLQASVDEHVRQVRITPTDLEVHASLAGTYVALSKVYKQANQEEKYRMAARLAIEEFSILSHYAPNDPWVHEQLAIGYHDLGMAEEEMREVETLLKLRASDKEILYRLGHLYFRQGMNAKGLKIYEELKKGNFKKAEDLISSYGNFAQK
ncbi:MAG: hypothetical protein KGQ49_02530, partial [Verrucomicrobia bacterium]|nr:hypothetical protein [Verrucomicrobiota bacterium]